MEAGLRVNGSEAGNDSLVSVPVAGWDGLDGAPHAVLLAFTPFPESPLLAVSSYVDWSLSPRHNVTRLATYLDCAYEQETLAKLPFDLRTALGKELSVVRNYVSSSLLLYAVSKVM